MNTILAGYEGKNCEVANCEMSQCFNDATCVIEGEGEEVETWKCVCPQHYIGKKHLSFIVVSYSESVLQQLL